MPLRFAHLADLHLDTPFRGLGKVAPALAGALADASLLAWDRAVETCLAQRVDFVLIAGDIYDQEEAGVRAQLRFLRGLERLAVAGVPALVVHGNHDPNGGRWPAVRDWPQTVTVFGSEGVEVVPVRRDGKVLALVHGMSFAARHVAENLARRFHRTPEPVYQIGLLHALVGDHPEHGRYAPCALEDLAASGLDYWALGHVHAREVVCRQDPAVVYPGNLQARHPGETGPRGFYIVEAELGAAPRLTFCPADLWRFATIELDLGEKAQTALADVLGQLGQAAAAARDGRGLIARARLTGATALHPDLSRPGARDDLLQQLRDDAAADGELWWDDLRILTRPVWARARRLEAGDFVADLLRQGDARRPEARQRLADALAVLRRSGALQGLGDVLEGAGLEAMADELWAEAERLAVDRLEQRAAAE